VRDGNRRLRAGRWVAGTVGAAAALSLTVIVPALAHQGPGGARQHGSSAATAARNGGGTQARTGAAALREYQSVLAGLGRSQGAGGAVAEATTARQLSGESAAAAAQNAGVLLPGGAVAGTVPAGPASGQAGAESLGKLSALLPADLLVVAPTSLPASAITKVRRLAGVKAVSLLDAARIEVNGGYVATLGVDPATFREFAEKPTAQATTLWQNVADGGIAISYLMGKQEKIPLGGAVAVTGASIHTLPVAGFGTVGISGVDAVVSDAVARTLGMPAGNAIVISAPDTDLSTLMSRLKAVLPAGASVAPLVAQAPVRGLPVTAGSAGAIGVTAADGPGLTVAQTRAFLTAALSRVGLPYVWGGDGPAVFDCSGLVQWSMRQAGIVMPRVAADQAQTGPQIPLSELQPGDLLFYHTDPTAPQYISHVAIYLGNGLMLQAPEPGMDVQVVPAIFGQGFAGAVRVYPRVAAYVAGNPAG
jgi:cell wall-associated NlpC family hydrolase